MPDSSKFVGAGNRVIELLDMKPDIDASSPDGIKLGRAKGAIRFEVRRRDCALLRLQGVHFRYPTRPDVPVLRGLSIYAEPGEFVALVGASGSGKSTVIALTELFCPSHLSVPG